jgi:tetratricopeptide (TPR) repeat protein
VIESEPTASSLISEGSQYLSTQNFALAKTCFLRALEIDKSESEALFLLSWIAHQENELQLACEYLQKANSIQPFNKKYLSGLANIYSQIGEFQKAIELYQGYLRMDSSQAEIYYNYACTLTKVKEIALAVDAFQNAISLDSKQLHYYMAFGQLLYLINQYRDAQKVYLSALNQGLSSEGLFQNIAKLHADFGELEESKAILLQASTLYPENLSFIYRLSMQDPQVLTPLLLNKLKAQTDDILTPDNQFYRNWLLSQFSYQDNKPMEEMAYLVKAHTVFEALNKFSYDKSVYLKTLSQLDLPAIHNIDELQDEDSNLLEPIFIIGVPRCGSTLIENIICSGSERILKGEETGTIFHAVMNSLQKNSTENTDQSFWINLKEQAKGLYQNANLIEGKARFTDKSLENSFLVNVILSLYPKAKIIYCDRHPLASIISIMKNNMVTLPWAHNLDDIFEYVDNCIQAINKWQEQFPENIYTIKYENLVLEPEVESKKLMAFCDLEWHESCLDFHKNKGLISKTASHLQVREKINQNALNTHQKYKDFFQGYKSKYSWLN